ncbi:MAG: Methyltransferase type 11, partial [Myxococcaceae bacterium]|nr:Methyltransferase type 11 [Myxococcaceae bacterium]
MRGRFEVVNATIVAAACLDAPAVAADAATVGRMKRDRFAVVVALAGGLGLALGNAGCSRATHSGPGASGGPGASATTAGGNGAVDPLGTYMGRTLATPMSYQGADWLDRSDRETTEQPEHVLDVLGVKEGMNVADVGAGSGYFTVRIAKRIAPRGHVLATDLQPEMLDLLRAKVKEAKLTNVVPVLTTESDAKLPRGELDLVLMVDVYHELPKPAQTLAQVRAALRPDGR